LCMLLDKQFKKKEEEKFKEPSYLNYSKLMIKW